MALAWPGKTQTSVPNSSRETAWRFLAFVVCALCQSGASSWVAVLGAGRLGAKGCLAPSPGKKDARHMQCQETHKIFAGCEMCCSKSMGCKITPRCGPECQLDLFLWVSGALNRTYLGASSMCPAQSLVPSPAWGSIHFSAGYVL